jgi:flagellar biosynthesis protein FliP
MNKKLKRIFLIFSLLLILFSLTSCDSSSELSAPGVTFSISPADQPQQVTTGVQLLVLLTVLSLAPSIMILCTSFTRIVIVLSMVRNAIGTASIPPNQVIIGLSLLLTFFVMQPTINEINTIAVQPYLNNQIDQQTAITNAINPLRNFMFAQTRDKDIELFLEIRGTSKPATIDDIPTSVLLPAFVISELKTALTMGFLLYVPFLIIDLVISSILLSMGMMMLPPSLVSLPFKLLLFIMADGWYLITRSLMLSFGG